MAISRKKILEKIAGKCRGIDYHLDEHIPALISRADEGLVEYWRKEVSRLIDDMERWGQRLAKDQAILADANEY